MKEIRKLLIVFLACLILSSLIFMYLNKVFIDVHYEKATYNFGKDPVGSAPSGWNIYKGGGQIAVISEKDNHKKLVILNDTNENQVKMYQNINNMTTGTVEFWLQTNNSSKEFGFSIRDNDRSGLVLLIKDGYFQYYDVDYKKICSINSNQWLHIRIDFNCSNDWHLLINRSQIDEVGYSFYQSPQKMTSITFETGTIPLNFAVFIDDIGYSWDPNYKIGDNWDLA